MIKTIPAVIVALATGALGAVLGYMSSNREMDVKMVEIAVGILSQEPQDNIALARQWAVDVISHYSEDGVKPSQEVRDALVNYKAFEYVGTSWITTGYTDSYYPEGSGRKTPEIPAKPN
jgi:hypothetical protein